MFIHLYRHRNKYGWISSHRLVYLHTFPSNKAPLATSITSTQILSSKYHSPIKGTRTPWTCSLFPGWAEKTRQSRLSCIIKKIRKHPKKKCACQKELKPAWKKFPIVKAGRIWAKYVMISLNYNPKINKYPYVPTNINM